MLKDFLTFVQGEKLGKGLCGKSRPIHFREVTTVLIKLFNIVKPDRAYFGQKDAQQLVIVKKMEEDLNMDVEIIGCHIVRETDGLAISSRNTYLSPEERNDALFLNKSLKLAENLIENGEKNISTIKDEMEKTNIFENEKVQIVNINNGERFETYVIKGPFEKGDICLNGAAARLVESKDKIIIMSYCLIDENEAENFNPKVVFVDENNNSI